MKELFIYHENTGRVIPLTDKVYLCDTEQVSAFAYGAMLTGASVPISEHKGWRLDNRNMTYLFFGE